MKLLFINEFHNTLYTHTVYLQWGPKSLKPHKKAGSKNDMIILFMEIDIFFLSSRMHGPI